jgi:hypothetical protein
MIRVLRNMQGNSGAGKCCCKRLWWCWHDGIARRCAGGKKWQKKNKNDI